MLPRTALEKYCTFVEKESFWFFVEKWADKLHSTIVGNRQLNEPRVVKKIVQELNGLGFAGIRTYTAFIHQKPYVWFYDSDLTKKKAELGDLIFIVSVIHKGRKIFERVTINQAKKGVAPKIDAEQLFLLSRFPVFRLPRNWGGKVYALPNYSHCLGSHSLLSNEFTFISSVLLDYALGPGQSFKVGKLRNLFDHEDFLFPRVILNDDSFSVVNQCISELLTKWEKVWWDWPYYNFLPLLWSGWWYRRMIPPVPMLLNVGYAWNVRQFAVGYLLSWIGEIVWGNPSSPNPQTWELIQDIVGSMAALGDEEVKEFVAKFREYSYEGETPSKGQAVTEGNNGGSIDDKDEEGDGGGGGFGIVYTEVNLNEID